MRKAEHGEFWMVSVEVVYITITKDKVNLTRYSFVVSENVDINVFLKNNFETWALTDSYTERER